VAVHEGWEWRFGTRFFWILALMIFLLKFIFKKVLRNRLFSLWRRHPVLELQFVLPLRVTPMCFATQRLQIAVEWLRKGFSLLCIILQYCLLQLRVVNRIFVAA
jgi:hypothetical protein